MNIEVQMYDNDKELTIECDMNGYGSIIFHTQTRTDPAEYEVLSAPEFDAITLTDSEDNTWKPSGEQLKIVEETLYDWWYEAAISNDFS